MHDYPMAHVMILYGGRSGEHEVSRRSAAAVFANIHPRHDVRLIFINTEGLWYRQDPPGEPVESLDILSGRERLISVVPGRGLADSEGRPLTVDVVLPILHGNYGEDGAVQGLLESARVPYAGSGILGSSLGMDKDRCKAMLKAAGIPVVPWRALQKPASESEFPAAGKLFESLKDELGLPLFIKPANAGSSVGVSRVEKSDQLEEALRTAWKYDRKILIETCITGREIECAVIGREKPRTFPPGEIVISGGHHFYDYNAKYIDPDGAVLQVPAKLEEKTALTVERLAARTCKVTDAGGLARVDFLMDEKTDALYVNEINTLPGMTSISLFPRMAQAGGMSFQQVIESLIEDALAESAYRESRSYRH